MNSIKFAKIDLKITKMQSKTIIVFIIIAVVLTIYFSNPIWGMMYTCFGSIIMSMIPFNYVNAPNCGFLNMLPATTFSRVMGRYLYSVIMTLAAILIGLISVVIGTFAANQGVEGLAPIALSFFLFALLCQWLQYLLAYIMAPFQNQQMVIMLLRMIPAFIFFGVASTYSEDINHIMSSGANVIFNSIQLTQANMMIGILLLAGVVLIVGAVCIALSYYFVKKRDLCC